MPFVDKKDFPRSIYFLEERGNIILTRTFSKAYGLAGLRIGYGITTPNIAQSINKVREPFNVNRFAQECAYHALSNKGFLNRINRHVKEEKKYLYKELEKLHVKFVRSVTNFILVNFGSDVKSLYNYLLKEGVIVRNLDSWGLKSFFRVTIGLHKENKKFICHLRKYLTRNLRKRH